MATRRSRGSTRRSSSKRDREREPEPVVEDDEDDFAWQTPPPKKKKKKSTGKSARSKTSGGSARSSKTGSTRTSASGKKKATGKRKRPTGSSAVNPKASSSLKRSGKRKKATSARRPRDDDDDDDDLENTSGRRRRAAPPKKKGVDPIIPISIVTGSLILCGGIFFIKGRKSKVVVRDEDQMLKDADALTKKGVAAFQAWNKVRKANGPIALEMQKHKEALDLLEQANAKMEEALAPYRDKNTGFLKKGYQGYEKTLQVIGQYRYDLQKSARTN